MADYYPLLSRAVRNLPNASTEARQAVFLRARDALERQLRSITPRLTDADIIRELLSLEDVIKRIERELEAEQKAADESLRRIAEAASALEDPAASEADQPDLDASTLPDAAQATTPQLATGDRITARPRIPIDASRGSAEKQAVPAASVAGSGIATELLGPENGATLRPATDSGSTARIRLPTDGDATSKRNWRGLFAAAGVVAILGMGAVALLNRESPDRYRPIQEATAPAASAVADQAKQEGRLATGDTPASPIPAAPVLPPSVPQRQVTSVPIPAPVVSSAPAPASQQPALPVASRGFMILEVPGRTPNQYEGFANWSFSPDPATRSPEKALRVLVEFSSAGFTFEASISRATDASLNASHIATLNFTPNEGISAVREMGAIEWREREGQPGTPLAGTLVPIQDNLFMIGLDATQAGRARNLDMMRTQRWMVFEIRLADNRRGAFLVEKGSSGDKAVAEALAAWQ